MKQQTQSTFNEGMVKDLYPLVTPQTILTDALNGTLITYNGNEFQLQNDMGNTIVERAKLSPGFIPIGMKEYGGIIYVVSYNPETGADEVGSFPSPERDFDTSDFDNLSPANFETSDFVVNTGTPVNEVTNVIRKLIEPEVLQLNPGDMYVVVYDINDPIPGSTSPDEIDNQAKMDEYISKDVLNRKLFGLKFYKISDDNNRTPLDPDDVKVIEDKPDLEGEYVYFKENSAGTIAVGLELETMDIFDVNVIDTSRATNDNKSIAIEAVGYSNSMAEFKGVRVDISAPTTETFYITKTGSSKKVSAKIDQLAANDTVTGSVTPYSPYALYPKLKKDFQVEIGKYASAGAGVNNIFRYYYSPNSFKVEFDFKFEGDSIDGLHLYAEFYDPWSDYSIVKTIDNPTYYGINSLIMELVDEPVTTVFDSNTRGGTPTNLLFENPDVDFQKTLLNSTNLIRTNTALRRNHFYIVRISGVDKDYSVSPVEYKHYDFYKGVYTNDMFNSVYNNQASAQPGTPQYVPDFNQLDFIKNNIHYDSTITKTQDLNIVSNVIEVDTTYKTSSKYYAIKTVDEDITGKFYKSGNTHTNTRSFDIDLALKGTGYIFGTFKEDILTLSVNELASSDDTDPGKAHPTVTDLNYSLDPDIAPNSKADWSITELAEKKYRINTSLETTRWVWATVKRDPGVGGLPNRSVINKEIPMRQQLYYNESVNNITTWSPHRITVTRNDTTQSMTEFYCYVSGADLKNKFDSAIGGPTKGALLGRMNAIERVTCDGTGKTIGADWPNMPQWFTDGDAARMPVVLLVRGGGNEAFYLTKSTDINAILAFFNTLYAHSAVETDIFVFYPNTGTLKYNGTITTNGKYTGAEITTTFSPITPELKTYLSEFYLKANNAMVDFSTENINDYIATRLSDSTIVDNKSTIRDGFIPYVDSITTIVTPIVLPEVNIVQAASSTLRDAYIAGESQWKNDESIGVISKYNHGQLYTKDDKYSDFVKWFKLTNFFTGTEINPNTTWIVTNTSNLGNGNYIDAFRNNKIMKENGTPSILVDIAITNPS